VDVVLVEHQAEHADHEEVQQQDGALLHCAGRVHVIYKQGRSICKYEADSTYKKQR
jgi:hypothetical protein